MPVRLKDMLSSLRHASAFASISEELSWGLSAYWTAASRVLDGSGIRLLAEPKGYHSLEKNFFSALFLYSYQRAGIGPKRRRLYAAVNQCLRGMVTGCDNILDNEYKETLATDLPSDAARFRSIIDIMASDRVLFELLLDEAASKRLTLEEAGRASRATLRALSLSGVQEAAEEGGAGPVPTPEAVIKEVHHYKTGLLFKAPLAVPRELEGASCPETEDALYSIGMGCQLLDDMVDMARDLAMSRHNLLVSLAYHGPEKDAVEEAMSTGVDEGDTLYALNYPAALRQAAGLSKGYLDKGLSTLFSKEGPGLPEAAQAFLAERIGAARLLEGAAS